MAYKLLFLLFAGAVSAQSLRTNNQQQFLNAKAPRNYVINSGAENNDLSVTDASGIHSRTPTTPLKGNGSHLINATAGSQSVVFLTEAFQPELFGRNCQASFIFNGDASLYTVAAVQNSANVSGLQTLTNPGTSAQPVSLYFPCGDGSNATTLVFTSTGDGAAIKIDDVYVGEAYGEGVNSQAEVVLRANRASGNQAIASTAITKVQINTETYDPYGQFDPTTNYRFTASKSGEYLVQSSLYLTGTASEIFTLYLYKNGSEYCQKFVTFNNSDSMINLTCQVPLAVGDYLEIFIKSSADTSYSVVAGAATSLLSIERFPTASEQTFKVDAPGVLPTSYVPAIVGAGTVTNNSATYQCIAPSTVYAFGRFTAGPVDAVEARISLPPGFTSADSSQIPLLRQVGSMSTSAVTATSFQTFIEPSVTYITGGFQNSGSGGLTKKAGNLIWATGNIVSWFATVPVTSSSPCAKTAAPLYVGAVSTPNPTGVTSIIGGRATRSGTCSNDGSAVGYTISTGGGTGQCVFTFASGVFDGTNVPNCDCTSRTVGVGCSVAITASALTTTTWTSSTGAAVDNSISFSCRGPK